MSNLNKAIVTYIFASIITILIEYIFNVPLNAYFYLDIILESFSDSMVPMMPTTGNWADSANDAILMTNIARLFFSVMSSPIPLIAAIIVYAINNDDSRIF